MGVACRRSVGPNLRRDCDLKLKAFNPCIFSRSRSATNVEKTLAPAVAASGDDVVDIEGRQRRTHEEAGEVRHRRPPPGVEGRQFLYGISSFMPLLSFVDGIMAAQSASAAQPVATGPSVGGQR